MAGYKLRFTQRGNPAAKKMIKRGKKAPEIFMEAQREAGEVLLEKAKALSSFTAYPKYVTPGPYGKGAVRDRRGRFKARPPMPTKPWEANVHEGNLQRGWRMRVTPNRDGASISLSNTSKQGRYFTGIATKRMIARPLVQKAVGESVHTIRVLNQKAVNTIWEEE